MNNVNMLERKVNLLIDYVTCPEADSERKESLLLDLKDLKSKISDKNKSLKHTVEDFLTDFGVPSNILGYKYLTTSVCLIIENPELASSVCRSLYPEVARIHSTTSTRVERAIRHAIESAVDRVDGDVVCKVFGNSVSSCRGKPTNTEFIFRVAQVIEREMV